jgi:CO/xanthine dehydrogenase FAD-binding subunit
MNELAWHFPSDLVAAVKLLEESGAAPHAGGTGLLRTGTSNLTGLVDLRKLPLRYLTVNAGSVELGAMLTFADVVEQMRPLDPGSVLIKSLGRAASTPLRHRITVGGSIAMAPLWSDLMGPLLALDAEVVLLSENEITLPFARLLDDRATRKGKLVKAVRFAVGEWQSCYFRAATTHFDYAAFTITALAKKNSRQEIEDARIVVTGNKQRYKRLVEQERALIGRKAGDGGDLAKVAGEVDVEFAPKTIGSPEYVRHLFGVELQRALAQIVRG